ncbi:hypothetical protein BSKO_03039 [Bryopsis sp. KO-2023]|nr:hypothetical protein BSKO_03039 [Bryopsis sp. KO-2023]
MAHHPALTARPPTSALGGRAFRIGTRGFSDGCFVPRRINLSLPGAKTRAIVPLTATSRGHSVSGAPVAAMHTAVVEDVQVESSESESDADVQEVDVGVGKKALDSLMDGAASAVEEEVRKVKTDVPDDSLKLTNCGLSQETLKALEKRGVVALFPIQKHVFDPAMAGKDLICRAKTGSGKTLAFALPVIEGLLKEDRETRPQSGRAPRAIVMAPTRELANQVAREFQSAASSLRLGCFYGGVPVMGQKRLLRDGIDVACGTPGRIIDLIEQRALNLSKIRYVIMDESDSMLDMGFEEDMEQILQHAPKERQTLLFSATLPQWVKKVARKYLTDHIVVDLVGDDATGKISDTIRAMGIVVDGRQKRTVLGDLLSVHASSSNSIVFTQTKREADVLSAALADVLPTEALHGDIPQGQRENTLKRFRDGKFNTLVATDVAARGLDIPNVDLVVHYDMPDSGETFLHRSGRTGRAGKKGSTIVMIDRRDVRAFHRIVRETRTKIEMIGPPAPREVMQSSAKTVLQRMQVVEPEVVKFFQPAAEKVISSGNQAQVLAAAFAAMSGFSSVPQHRSLLTHRAGYVTLRCLGRPGRIHSRAVVQSLIRDILGGDSLNKLDRTDMIDDHETQMTGALFDLPVDLAITFLQNASQQTSNESRGLQFDRPKCLTLDQVLHDDRGGGDRFGRFGGRGGRGGRGGGGSRYGGARGGRDGGYGGRESWGGGRERGGGSWGGRDSGRDSGRGWGGDRGSRGGWGDRSRSGGGGGSWGGRRDFSSSSRGNGSSSYNGKRGGYGGQKNGYSGQKNGYGGQKNGYDGQKNGNGGQKNWQSKQGNWDSNKTGGSSNSSVNKDAQWW